MKIQYLILATLFCSLTIINTPVLAARSDQSRDCLRTRKCED